MSNRNVKLISLLMIILIITGCSPDINNQIQNSGTVEVSTEGNAELFAMDTIMSISASGINAQEAINAAESEIYKLESLLDVTDESSDIYDVNAAAGQPVTVSGQMADIVTKALEISEMTGGIFNIAMYPIIREWGFTTGEYKIPDDDTLRALLQNTDYSLISLKNGSVTIPEGMAIDVGGIAKGFASDMVRDILEERGITSALIDLGGDVRVIGAKADGSDWRVAVQNPTGSDYLGVLSVKDCAIMTSGSYERYFTGDDGIRYHHIMDPETGRPAESGLISVTVVAEDGCLSDALATALFIMGADRAAEFWRSRGGFEAIWVTEESEIYITEGLVDSFELSAGFEDFRIIRLNK